jgi:uncharacterized protein YgbK (DUF1537 family)
MRWLGVADDLTGAADLAASLGGRGEGIWVAWEAARLRGLRRSAVLDAETRFSAPKEAFRRVCAAWAALDAPAGPFLRYQKIDSTLRGNPGEEILAFAAATAAPWVAVQPAYPSQGRILRGPFLWVHGRRLDRSEYAADPLTPSRAAGPLALFPRRLGAQAPLRVVRAGVPALTRWIRARRGVRFLCFDCLDDADMERTARACLAAGGRHFAGASDLGAALARLLDGPAHPAHKPRGLPWVLLAGSVSAQSFAQLASLEAGLWIPLRRRQNGTWRVLGRRELGVLRRRLRRRGGLALSSLASREELRHWRRRRHSMEPQRVAEHALEGLVRAGLAVGGGLGRAGYLLTGGHSLAVFCRLAGLERLEVLGQALPGVPLSRAEGPGGRSWLASKPGGFGGPRLLADFLEGR